MGCARGDDSAWLSQEAVAHNAGLTDSAYAQLERGEARTTVTQVAKALSVTLSELGRVVERMR